MNAPSFEYWRLWVSEEALNNFLPQVYALCLERQLALFNDDFPKGIKDEAGITKSQFCFVKSADVDRLLSEAAKRPAEIHMELVERILLPFESNECFLGASEVIPYVAENFGEILGLFAEDPNREEILVKCFGDDAPRSAGTHLYLRISRDHEVALCVRSMGEISETSYVLQLFFRLGKTQISHVND